jgi:hypothetical protein
MAIDYGIQVPQIQPVQQGNMLQQVMLFNQMKIIKYYIYAEVKDIYQK